MVELCGCHHFLPNIPQPRKLYSTFKKWNKNQLWQVIVLHHIFFLLSFPILSVQYIQVRTKLASTSSLNSKVKIRNDGHTSKLY